MFMTWYLLALGVVLWAAGTVAIRQSRASWLPNSARGWSVLYVTCLFVTWVFPRFPPSATGPFGGWMLISCAGVVVGAFV